jgi:hypothetical protein
MVAFRKVGTYEEFMKPSATSSNVDILTAARFIDDKYAKLLELAKRANSEFLKDRFEEHRKSDPNADVVVLSEEGRMVGGRYWATLSGFLKGSPEFPPTMLDLTEMMNERHELVYELTPTDRMMLFFPASALEKIEDVNGAIFPEPYADGVKVQGETILRAYVRPTKKDKFGKATLKELAVGRIRFWTDRETGEYKLAVNIRGHPASERVYISPLDSVKAHENGMLLEPEKPGREHWIRMQIGEGTDPILDAFNVYFNDTRVNSVLPVMRYETTERPWEAPQLYAHP